MKKKLTIYVVAVMMFLMHIGYYDISYGQNESNIMKMLASTQTLPKAGIDNEHILISIACLIIITGAFFVFFKKREKK
ncbi:MAG: LPXTG cell wall anchor domain-containing protein [Finegoldia magna]|uniref:LPXTG cell wall anchor domain-containing protein n=1 Tax=Finegoldia magna TaxID=1260 RepID=UPI001F5B0F66|nr:LPXTG cell wall anchor domain-containing protein [Finegoldia magna]MDU2640298.1 LPXTG cell wall anchor domain-containing protein [Finegoldia magna]MDU5508835.1 LPXTG cell wall anchor domain-containing protein [Finegoldia magna]